MTTVNTVGVGLKGSTGTGNFVGTASPTFTGTPILGAASATSLTFTSTSGIIGTTTNNSAALGSVGEVIFNEQLRSGSGISLTTNTPTNICSITLTAGDWWTWGNTYSEGSGGAITSPQQSGINSVSATLPSNNFLTSIYKTTQFGGFDAPPRRVSLSGSATYYLVLQSTFSVGSAKGYGGLYARRRR